MGSGRQYMPWISLDDWLAAITYLLDQPSIAGPVNVVGPDPVRNAEFSAALGRVLHRPSLVPVPAFALRIAVGELADATLESKRVIPRVLAEHGFPFAHRTVDEALRSAVG
jgi:NAD dependent epimerase/dehydratase family enzyme